jgi:hypothetical protein
VLAVGIIICGVLVLAGAVLLILESQKGEKEEPSPLRLGSDDDPD